MANITLYTAQKLESDSYTVFSGVYNDFKVHSYSEYKFELEPLCYEDFIESVSAGLIECIILLEDNVPTGFLAYTTLISESIELNIIHCLGEDNLNQKRKILLEKFLELNEHIIEKKVVTYPMLGTQADFVRYMTQYGFKMVGISVVRFYLTSPVCLQIMEKVCNEPLKEGYYITDWQEHYHDAAVKIIHEAFKDTADALFDPRFRTLSGTADVVGKIVSGYYGDFLSYATKLLLKNGELCGLCFVNLTAGTIANIPLVGIGKEHRRNSFGKYLLKAALQSVHGAVRNSRLAVSEVNASVETDNYPAVRMYRCVGFKEDYSYPQAYLPVKVRGGFAG